MFNLRQTYYPLTDFYSCLYRLELVFRIQY